MPHAESKMSQTQTQVLTNGETKSQFISHLKSYPVVSDGIDTFKANPYGAKSIEIADAAYDRVGKPLEPHLRTPLSYARPYVERADNLADQALNSVDSRFPIVKENTSTIFDTVKSYAYWPFELAGSGRDYVFNTFDDEYKRTVNHNNRGPGIRSFAFAVVSTELKIASDALTVAANYLNPKKDELKQKANELAGEAKKQKDTYAKKAQQAANESKQD